MRHLTLFLLLVAASLQAQVTFQRTFGSAQLDQGFYVARAAGGFVLAGTTDLNSAGGTDACIMKTDFSGNLQWMKTAGGAGNELAIFTGVLPNGDIVSCGETFSVGMGGGDAFMCRMDSSGNVIWLQTWGDTLYDIAYSYAPTSDGGFIVCGLTQEAAPADFDAFLIRTDASGDTLWTRQYGGPGIDHAVSVIQTADGGFAFSGKCMSFGAGSSDIYLVRTDAAGDTLWTRVIGGTGWDEGMCLREMPNGDLAICGGTNSYGEGDYDHLLLRTDASGVVLWMHTYGGPKIEAAYGMSLTADGGFVFTGYTETFGEGHAPANQPGEHVLGTDSANVMTIRTNGNGDTTWCMSYGGPKKEESFMVLPYSDGGFVIAGYSSSFGNDSDNVMIIRTDSLGRSGCFEEPIQPQVGTYTPQQQRTASVVRSGFVSGSYNVTAVTEQPGTLLHCISTGIIEPGTAPAFTVYPNPSGGQLTVSCKTNGNHEVELYNSTGQRLHSESFIGNSKTLSLENYPAGIYLLRLDRSAVITLVRQ